MRDKRQLSQRATASDVIHPSDVLQVILHSVQDSIEQLNGHSLTLTRECDVGVVLTQELTKRTTSSTDALSPKRLRLRLTSKELVEEGEVEVAELLR